MSNIHLSVRSNSSRGIRRLCYLLCICMLVTNFACLGAPSAYAADAQFEDAPSLRFINYKRLNTIDPKSKWRSAELWNYLVGILSADLADTSSCEQVWYFSAEDYEDVHKWCQERDKGDLTNEEFLTEFGAHRIDPTEP